MAFACRYAFLPEIAKSGNALVLGDATAALPPLANANPVVQIDAVIQSRDASRSHPPRWPPRRRIRTTSPTPAKFRQPRFPKVRPAT